MGAENRQSFDSDTYAITHYELYLIYFLRPLRIFPSLRVRPERWDGFGASTGLVGAHFRPWEPNGFRPVQNRSQVLAVRVWGVPDLTVSELRMQATAAPGWVGWAQLRWP